MEGMKLDSLEFVRLLPQFMRDDEAVAAFSKATDALIGLPGKRLETLRTWDQIDKLNDAECDELAWELGIDWYESRRMSLEEKRETIKTAQQIKQKRGTKQAVEQILVNAYGNGSVEEWFEYGGDPYSFRVRTDAVLTEENNKRFRQMIRKAKNVRSHLQLITVERTANFCEYVGTACMLNPRMVIQCERLNYAYLGEYVGLNHVVIPKIILT